MLISESLKIIGVIGGSHCSAEEYDLAYKVGQGIAKAEAILICGGRGGIMEASCKGAVEAGGLTIGILPGDDINEANHYVKLPIATGLGIARNIIIVKTAQVLISIAGRYGTLSEMAFAAQVGKPLYSLCPWIDIPDSVVVKTPEEAVRRAIQSIK